MIFSRKYKGVRRMFEIAAIIIAIVLAVSLVVGGLITFLVYNKIRKGMR